MAKRMERMTTGTNDIIEKNGITKGSILYYAQALPLVGIFEVLELKVRTVTDEFFVGIDKVSKHAYLFHWRDLDESIFFNRSDALGLVKERESNSKKISNETEYEEY